MLAETTLTSRGVTAIQRQESQLEASAKYRSVQNISWVATHAQAICLNGKFTSSIHATLLPFILSSLYRDLQLQLNQSKNECGNLKQQLANSRTSSQQYKEIADSAEKRLAENNNAAKALKADLETRLKKAVEEREAVEARMREMEEANRAAPGTRFYSNY